MSLANEKKHSFQEIGRDLNSGKSERIKKYASDSDTYIRKNTYIIIGKLYRNKIDADSIWGMLEKALNDEHQSVRNAVIGSLKQMGAKNPRPTLEFARKFLHHHDPKIRREIVHGIELRGRTHPEEILEVHKRYEKL